VPETTQALKGRNRRCVNRCAHVRPFQGFGELGRRRTQGDRVRPRVALRSTLGYLIMPRWGKRSGYGSVLIANSRRPKLRWVTHDQKNSGTVPGFFNLEWASLPLFDRTGSKTTGGRYQMRGRPWSE